MYRKEVKGDKEIILKKSFTREDARVVKNFVKKAWKNLLRRFQ